MQIELNIFISGVERKKGKVTIEVPNGATVKEALKQYEKEYNIPFAVLNEKELVIIVNQTPAKPDDVLADKDSIKIFEPLTGG